MKEKKYPFWVSIQDFLESQEVVALCSIHKAAVLLFMSLTLETEKPWWKKDDSNGEETKFRNNTYGMCCQGIFLLISQGSFRLGDIDDFKLLISLCEWSRNLNHPLSKSVFMRFRGFTLLELDYPSLMRLLILLCHNSVPNRCSLPMSPDTVDCWGSGSVTEVTAAGLNIHLVPSTDTKMPPSLSTSNTFPVRPRIYKRNKEAY